MWPFRKRRSKIVDRIQFGVDICKAFGFVPEHTQTITIEIPPNDFPILTVRQLVTDETSKRFQGVVRDTRFRLAVEASEDNDLRNEEWPGAKIVETTPQGATDKTYGLAVNE